MMDYLGDLQLRLDRLLPMLAEPDQLSVGLTGSGNIYIFDYHPQDELLLRERLRYLEHKLTGAYVPVLAVDLFALIVARLSTEGVLEDFFRLEEEETTDYVLQAFYDTLSADVLTDDLLQLIRQHSPRLVFISGLGKAWPVLRSHTIINNLAERHNGCPVIFFYPGTYRAAQLSLFGQFSDGNHYRAFHLLPPE